MPEKEPERSSSPDVRTIHRLVRLMQRYDLTAIDLIEGQNKIRLRRRTELPASATPAPSTAAPAVNQAPAVAAPPQAAAPAAASAQPGSVIESPMVGTFYASPAPDAPPFVQPGSVVRPDTVVCVIEAMKVFTDIPAGVSGTIADVLVKNGEAVEYSQALFRITPA